jgi:hypothetical protein
MKYTCIPLSPLDGANFHLRTSTALILPDEGSRIGSRNSVFLQPKRHEIEWRYVSISNFWIYLKITMKSSPVDQPCKHGFISGVSETDPVSIIRECYECLHVVFIPQSLISAVPAGTIEGTVTLFDHINPLWWKQGLRNVGHRLHINAVDHPRRFRCTVAVKALNLHTFALP